MATVIKFPGTRFAPLHVRSQKSFRVSLWVTDKRHPEFTRWQLQWAMQRAASFRCLDGFTDARARRGTRHSFRVGQPHLLQRFIREVEDLIGFAVVTVEVNGVRIADQHKRA